MSSDSLSSGTAGSTVAKLTQSQRNALTAIAVLGGLSALTVVSLLIHMLAVAILPRYRRWASTERAIIRSHFGIYFASLLFSNMMMACGSIIEVVWVILGEILEGSVCILQAVFLQSGDVAAAIFSSLIALHTFNAFILRARLPMWLVAVVVVLGWGMVFLVYIIAANLASNAQVGPLFGNAGLWCWITTRHPTIQLISHYVPIFISAGFSLMMYAAVFLSLRGWLPFGAFQRESDSDEEAIMTRNAARRMLWYPLANVVFITPISVVRLAQIFGHQFPFPAFVFAECWLSLSGLVNVGIFLSTRNGLSYYAARSEALEPGEEGGGTRSSSLTRESFFPRELAATPLPRWTVGSSEWVPPPGFYDRKSQLEQDRKSQLERDRKSQLEGDRKSQFEGDRKSQLEGDRKSQLEGDRKSQLEGDRKPQVDQTQTQPAADSVRGSVVKPPSLRSRQSETPSRSAMDIIRDSEVLAYARPDMPNIRSVASSRWQLSEPDTRSKARVSSYVLPESPFPRTATLRDTVLSPGMSEPSQYNESEWSSDQMMNEPEFTMVNIESLSEGRKSDV